MHSPFVRASVISLMALLEFLGCSSETSVFIPTDPSNADGEPTGIVLGRVTVNGFPGQAVNLKLESETRAIATTTTNSMGEYVFSGIAAGRITVSLVSSSNVICSVVRREVTVLPDEAVRADFACMGQVITGQVTLGESSWGGTVSLCAQGGSPCFPPVTTGSGGIYTFTNVAPGRYNVVAEPRARVSRSPTFVENITCQPQAVTVPAGATVKADIPCITDNPAGIGWWDY